MNILSNLPKTTSPKKKRLGRGLSSGKGAKSGRGTTRHQRAREGIPMHFEGGQGKMTKKFPLLRGKGKNKSVQVKPLIVRLQDLNEFKANDVITLDLLIEKNLVDERAQEYGVKILGVGKIEKKVTIKVPVTASAKKLIEKAGGKVEL